MVDQVLKLQEKRQLTGSDAFSVIQLLQEQTLPIFSLRNASLQPILNVRSTQSKHSQPSRRREKTSPNQHTHRPSLHQRVSPRGDGSPASVVLGSTPLKLDSVEEFPPIGSTVITTPRNRKKKSRGGPRRITPTPLQSQATTNGTEDGKPRISSDLKPNPVFTSACLTSEPPSLISEERRLLQQERMRSRANQGLGSNGAESSKELDCSTLCRLDISEETAVSGTPSSQQSSSLNNTHSCVNTNSQHRQSSGTIFSTTISGSSPILSPDKVKFKQELTRLSELYARVILSGLVPNISSELYFTIQLLTTSIPLSATDKLRDLIDSDEHIFKSDDACVYFAVSVLDLTRHLYTSLDKTTLQLLGNNIRIKAFNPELSEFFLSASEKAQERSSGAELHMTSGHGHVGIPFMEEADNSKNFTSMRAFHAFKRQRDGFYSLYRDWTAHHDTQGWCLHTELGNKIRILVSQSADTCSHAYLARLFQSQLVESCQHSLDPFFSLNSGLAGPLKMADPVKLLRLTERLVHRSSHGGVCPLPSFTGDEEFFKGFIIAADSYTFNHHLILSIRNEISKLHTSSDSLSEQALLPAMNTLRVLGKFLGLLVFLPHQLPAPLSLSQLRNMPVDILPYIKEAQQKGHLCTTVPWVVEYCSMMDAQALSAGVMDHIMEALVHVSCILEKDFLSRATFLVLASLGWLFEITGLAFSHFACKSSSDVNITDQEESCVPSVSVDVLYSCCPYLSELRSLLLEFNAGTLTKPTPLRKIKPSSTELVSDESSKRKTHHLRQMFEENFFRSHPSYVRQLCEVVSERSSSSAIAHFESVMVDELCQPLLSSLTSWLLIRGENGKLSDLHNSDVDRKVLVVCDNALSTAQTTAEQFFKNHCNSLAKRGVEGVMDSTSAHQCQLEISAVVAAIATQWALDRCHKWTTDKMRDCVCGHLMKKFDKLRRSITTLYTNDSSVSKVITAGFGVSDPVGLLPNEPMSSQDLTASTRDTVESPLEVLTTIQQVLIKPALLDEDLSKIQLCLSALYQHLHSTVCPLPNLYCQQLLPRNTRHLLGASFDLAVKLVNSRVWTRPPLDIIHLYKEEDNDSVSCFIHLLQLWHLLRKCRMELPVEKLLSHDVVHSFASTPSVAKVVSDLLISCVLCELVPSAVVEAVWMVRRHLTSTLPQLMEGGVWFLQRWYTLPSCIIQLLRTIIMGENVPFFGVQRPVQFPGLLRAAIENTDHLPSSVLSQAENISIIRNFMA